MLNWSIPRKQHQYRNQVSLISLVFADAEVIAMRASEQL